MSAAKPHYLLFCDGNAPASGDSSVTHRGRWKFVLENVETGERSEAADVENGCAPDRCALVSVLRGLESLEQPSRVTLITTSRYVSRGLQYGLVEWRDNDFSWEHFGAVQPIRNADIWRRIDRTLAYHQVQCRFMAQDEAASGSVETNTQPTSHEPSNHGTSETCTVTVASTRTSRNAVQTTTPTQRTIIPTANAQRIYVDTPIQSQALNTEIDGLHCGAAESMPLTNPTVDRAKRSAGVLDGRRSKNLRMERESTSRWLGWTRPLRWVASCQRQLCRNVWGSILAVDDWLDCFLRCLFLLEPKGRSSRH